MSKKKIWHNHFLHFCTVSISFAAVSSLIFPRIGNRSIADFEFPQSFDTGNVTAAQSNTNRKHKGVKATQQYQFVLDHQPFSLVIDYEVGVRGNLANYLQKSTQLNSANIDAKKIKYQPNIGHHALLKDDESVYLSSCISPRSLSSVTQKQFSRQRYLNDLNPIIVWQWFQNRASIRDRRCLWILLATPINSSQACLLYTSPSPRD